MRAVALLIFALSAQAQSPLERQIANIAAETDGRVAVACALPGSSIRCDLNAHAHPPMQSVFKAPLALTALHLIEQGSLLLDQKVRFRASDRIPHAYSPLQDKYSEAEVDIPLRELLRLAVSLSDNVAADMVLRAIGGPAVLNDYVHGLGISGFHIEDNEAALEFHDFIAGGAFERSGVVILSPVEAIGGEMNQARERGGFCFAERAEFFQVLVRMAF